MFDVEVECTGGSWGGASGPVGLRERLCEDWNPEVVGEGAARVHGNP